MTSEVGGREGGAETAMKWKQRAEQERGGVS